MKGWQWHKEDEERYVRRASKANVLENGFGVKVIIIVAFKLKTINILNKIKIN